MKGSPRILCLEDNEQDAELIEHQLSKMATRPELDHVSTGEDFRERLERGTYELILCDYSLPGFSGVEALHLARDLAPNTPFIFFSGTIGEDVAVNSLLLGATDYVVKQRPARLPAAITRALEVAELKRQQRSAQESLKFQSEILSNVTDGVIATDSDGKVVFWNPGAESIFACSAATVMMEPIQDIGLTSEKGAIARLLDTVKATGSAKETLACFSAGVREHVWVSISAKYLADSRGAQIGYLIIANDVTDLRNRESEVLDLNAGLEGTVATRTAALAEANDELRNFAHSVSHDLRSPLRAMAGYARSLIEDYSAQLGEEGLHVVNRIATSALRMDQISEGLLRLAVVSGTQLKTKTVSLSRLATEVAYGLSESDSDRGVEWAIEPNLIVKADESLLRSLLDNLLSNAWKFSATLSKARIEVGLEETSRGSAYFVRDNGVGFDPKHAERLFEPLQRLHRRADFEGVGIGLATAKRIITRHAGEIWAIGQVGEGATFYFTFPDS